MAVTCETLWRWWHRDEPETGLLGFHTKEDADAFGRGDPGPFRRRVSDDGRTTSQSATWDSFMQDMCDEADIPRRPQKQLN